jgi:hypothetical protein
MTCREARQLMDQPGHGELATHLVSCPRCRELWERRQAAERALGAVRALEPEPSADLAERIKAAVAQETLPQQALATVREAEIPVPVGLARRIKRAAADQSQAQRAPWMGGAPALAAALAGLLVAAVSFTLVGNHMLQTPPAALSHVSSPAVVASESHAVAPSTPPVIPVQPAVAPAKPLPAAPALVVASVASTDTKPAQTSGRHVVATRRKATSRSNGTSA